MLRNTREDGTEYYEMSAHTAQTPGIHPKERIQHPEQGERLKSRCFNSYTKYENKNIRRGATSRFSLRTDGYDEVKSCFSLLL
jgi:hypothetical protein